MVADLVQASLLPHISRTHIATVDGDDGDDNHNDDADDGQLVIRDNLALHVCFKMILPRQARQIRKAVKKQKKY